MEPKRYQVGAKGIIIKNDRVLLLFSRAGTIGYEYWDLPGGRLLPHDKSVEEGLIRELSEELPGSKNIRVHSLLDAMQSDRDFPDGSGLMLLFFKVSADLPESLEFSDEHLEYAWVERAALESYLSTRKVLANMASVIHRACEKAFNISV